MYLFFFSGDVFVAFYVFFRVMELGGNFVPFIASISRFKWH